jgi:hypothetical protein
MVNRLNSDTARKSNRPANDPRTSSQHRTFSSKTIVVDDVITSLANAHENRRARQVTEWQSVAARSLRNAAL